MPTEHVWMTEAALAGLVEELDALKAAAAGDDNSRARALELANLIARAEVGSKPDDGLVEPGMRVTVRFEDAAADSAPITFVLGDRTLLGLDDSIEVEVYSPTSPLGAAIDGRHVGDRVTLESPSGPRPLTIIAAAPAA